jgi:hypothetical protein
VLSAAGTSTCAPGLFFQKGTGRDCGGHQAQSSIYHLSTHRDTLGKYDSKKICSTTITKTDYPKISKTYILKMQSTWKDLENRSRDTM